MPAGFLPRKNFDRHISIGIYGGIVCQYGFDWDALFQLLNEHLPEVNALSFFENDSGYNDLGKYFLKRKGDKYDLNEDDEEWFEHIKKGYYAAIKYGGFRMESCAYTYYYDDPWRGLYWNGLPLHPYRENTANVNLAGKSGDKVYNNYKGGAMASDGFCNAWWLRWKPVYTDSGKPTDEVDEVKGANPLGTAMIHCQQRLAEMRKEFKASYPIRANYWIRGANEPDVECDPNGHYLSGQELDSRIENWLHKEHMDREFKKGRKYRLVRGGMVRYEGKQEPAYDRLLKNAKYCVQHNEIYELHSCMKETDASTIRETSITKYLTMAKKFELQQKLPLGSIAKATNFSFDGVKDDKVIAEARKVYQMMINPSSPELQVRNMDIKIPDLAGTTKDMNHNVQLVIPQMKPIFM